MRFLSVLTLFGFWGSLTQITTSSATLTSPLGPVVNLGYAAFAGNSTSPSGIRDSSVTFFGNVPYAQPPLGNLRFRAPQPLDERPVKASKIKIADARNWGPACIQQPAVVGVGSEDCLTVNVWKPTNATENSALPVVVYIHGGGLAFGTPQGFPLYDWVAQSSHGIIGVSITYRLNAFGFLASSAVAADGDLNAGLLDQRAALEWIQRNIQKFGGDPENITIAGESAGGVSVIMQVTAFGGKKQIPFKRAIAQSSGIGPTATSEQSEAIFSNVASVVGCSGNGRSIMSCLRSAPIGALVSAINHSPAILPVVDGPSGFLPDLMSRLITSGRFTPVDFIGGHCTNDGSRFNGGRPEDFISDDDVKRRVFIRWPAVSNATRDRALELYPLATNTTVDGAFNSQFERATAIEQDIDLSCLNWLLANQLSLQGAHNVFSYRWNTPDAVLLAANPFQGVMHTSDLYFLFDGTNTLPNSGASFTAFNTSESALSREAIAYWTSFAATGNPSAQPSPPRVAWVGFNASRSDPNGFQIVPTLGQGTATNTFIEVLPEFQIERCKFWMSEDVVTETRV